MGITKEELDAFKEKFASKEELDKALKDLKTQPEQDDVARKVFDHMKECKSDDCELHKYKQELEDDNLAMGFVISELIK